jgi:hypothetical protein
MNDGAYLRRIVTGVRHVCESTWSSLAKTVAEAGGIAISVNRGIINISLQRS